MALQAATRKNGGHLLIEIWTAGLHTGKNSLNRYPERQPMNVAARHGDFLFAHSAEFAAELNYKYLTKTEPA
jgi:hypothetical protein